MPGQGELESDDGRNGLEWLERASHNRRGMQPGEKCTQISLLGKNRVEEDWEGPGGVPGKCPLHLLASQPLATSYFIGHVDSQESLSQAKRRVLEAALM